MSDIYTISQNVRSKVDFELFMRKLQEDYATNQSIWENNQLEAYLEEACLDILQMQHLTK